MKKCSFDPRVYKNAPIGMFHCPECGEMVLAGLPHFSDDAGGITKHEPDGLHDTVARMCKHGYKIVCPHGCL